MSRDSPPDPEDTVSSEPLTGSASQTQSVECGICSFESFEYYPDEDVYRAMFDGDVVTPSMAVVGAVSTVADEDPLDIEPLHSTVDPDALDALFSGKRHDKGDIHARFSVAGHSVTVSSYGSIVVRSAQSEHSHNPVEGGD